MRLTNLEVLSWTTRRHLSLAAAIIAPMLAASSLSIALRPLQPQTDVSNTPGEPKNKTKKKGGNGSGHVEAEHQISIDADGAAQDPEGFASGVYVQFVSKNDRVGFQCHGSPSKPECFTNQYWTVEWRAIEGASTLGGTLGATVSFDMKDIFRLHIGGKGCFKIASSYGYFVPASSPGFKDVINRLLDKYSETHELPSGAGGLPAGSRVLDTPGGTQAGIGEFHDAGVAESDGTDNEYGGLNEDGLTPGQQSTLSMMEQYGIRTGGSRTAVYWDFCEGGAGVRVSGGPSNYDNLFGVP